MDEYRIYFTAESPEGNIEGLSEISLGRSENEAKERFLKQPSFLSRLGYSFNIERTEKLS